MKQLSKVNYSIQYNYQNHDGYDLNDMLTLWDQTIPDTH